ncbi:HNH endonuclease signature motif containing protein [Prescottella equi]|uniref:HNH endonuclease signature motif containing protein n=1 Tax=Rhodococcus hoagii TaxID=43767 RepID=UPI000A0FB38D
MDYHRSSAWKKFAREYRKTHDCSWCRICGLPIDAGADRGSPGELTIDHLAPVVDGGDMFDADNCAPTHRACNAAKAARGAGADYRRRLTTPPSPRARSRRAAPPPAAVRPQPQPPVDPAAAARAVAMGYPPWMRPLPPDAPRPRLSRQFGV